MQPVLSLERVEKRFSSGNSTIEVLRGVTLQLAPGDSCSLIGPSGSGKTSLLGIASGLELPSTGEVSICGQLLSSMSEEEKARLRNATIGFVFQSFQLIPSLTALENVCVPAEIRSKENHRDRAVDLLRRVGLEHRLDHYPSQLSGGEQQRVGLARAFINEPKLLLADEPTGNLDEETARKVEQLLFELNEQVGATLLIATHNLDLARKTKRLFRLSHGQLIDEAC